MESDNGLKRVTELKMDPYHRFFFLGFVPDESKDYLETLEPRSGVDYIVCIRQPKGKTCLVSLS